MNEALAYRLEEAAEWLFDDVPPDTRKIAHLEGDVKLSELELYCVDLMQQAARALRPPVAGTARETGPETWSDRSRRVATPPRGAAS